MKIKRQEAFHLIDRERSDSATRPLEILVLDLVTGTGAL